MVEFALVAPIFFFTVFSTVNGGLFLFARNSIEHAADIGMTTFAADGPTADSSSPLAGDNLAFSRMDAAGLTTTFLANITSVTLTKVSQSGAPISTCALGGGPGSHVCSETYDVDNGNVLPGQDYWPPASRNATTSGGAPDYAQLTVNYKYSSFGFNWSIATTVTNNFRLEPQE